MIAIVAAVAGFGFGVACGLAVALLLAQRTYRDIRDGRLRLPPPPPAELAP